MCVCALHFNHTVFVCAIRSSLSLPQLLSLAFVLPILQQDDEFATSDVQNAVLSSVIFIGMLCGSYTWGALADVLGRRFVLIFSFMVNGIFGAASSLSPNISVFIFFRFMSGVG